MSIGYLARRQKKVFYLKHGSRRFCRETTERMTAAFKGGITAVFATMCAGVFIAKTVMVFAIGATAAIICMVIAVSIVSMIREKE